MLGEDYVQYPNRALQSYGTPEQEVRTRDDKWHKDQCYVPIRHHRTRWAISFYFPATVTRDMGGTGVMPGSAYTTIDHDERAQDICVDTCEDFLANSERTAAKRAHLEALAHDGAFEHGRIHGEPEKRGTSSMIPPHLGASFRRRSWEVSEFGSWACAPDQDGCVSPSLTDEP